MSADRNNDDRNVPVPLDSLADTAGGESFEARHIVEYLRILYKRRWVVLGVFTVVSTVAILEAFSGSIEYEAAAQLLIEPSTPQIVEFQSLTPVVAPGVAEEAFYQTQIRILQSRSLARKTLERLKLWDHPEFGGSGEGIVAIPANLSVRRWILGAWNDAVSAASSWLGPQETQPTASLHSSSQVSPETRDQSRAIDSFLSHVDVSLVRNSRLVIVGFRAGDPVLAANVANALATGYIELNLESRFDAAKEASTFLAKRLAEQRAHVEKSELALQRYREETDAVSLDDKQNIVFQKLADLNAAVTRAKTLRIEKESQYQQLRNVQNDRIAIDSIPAILSHNYIQQLKVEIGNLQRQERQLAESLGEKHPELIKARNAVQLADARLQGEVAKVVQAIRNEFLSAEAQEKTLTAALESQKAEAQALNRNAIEYNVLERDAATNRQLFESLLQRSKETGIAEEMKTSNARVIDPAEVPRGPIARNRGRNVLVGVLGAMILGLAVAFVIDYLDNRIKAPEEIRAYLRVPFLGMIPEVKPADGDTLSMHAEVPRDFAEAVRIVRTNILFSGTGEHMEALLVTSSGPGEGKSTVACNIAVALAQAGKRVLLVDADMRRATIHTLFGVQRTPGLSNLIVGAAKASEVVHKTKVGNLWLLPAGAEPPNPAELLGSRRVDEFMKTLHDHFDWIVLDSPPILAVADAAVAANRAGRVLFVIGSEMTSKSTARTALQQIERSGAQVIGAVLNRAAWHRHPYYYADYASPSYRKYYQSA